MLDRGEGQRHVPLISMTLGLLLGMFRRITAAASRLFTADGAEGSFYSLESLNARVRAMVPTHPALVLLWCQILLLVSHTDYRWWAEVQQTPRCVCPPHGARTHEAVPGFCCVLTFLSPTLLCENVVCLEARPIASFFSFF